MSKIFDYTLYRTDGSIQALAPQEAMHPEDIEEMLGGYMDIAPPDLYRHRNLGLRDDVTVYVVENKLREDLDPNPHFVEFNGNVIVEKLHRHSTEDKHEDA